MVKRFLTLQPESRRQTSVLLGSSAEPLSLMSRFIVSLLLNQLIRFTVTNCSGSGSGPGGSVLSDWITETFPSPPSSLLSPCSSTVSVFFSYLFLFVDLSRPPSPRDQLSFSQTNTLTRPNTSYFLSSLSLCQLFVLQSRKTFVFTSCCQSFFSPLHPPVFCSAQEIPGL